MSKVKTINLQGKSFVQYPELLDAAHQLGLCRITTRIVQIPTEANGNVAIVEAEVVLKGEDGVENAFSGIGDASPQNVSRNILPHLLRMAETRSKARAMRDAVNVGYIDDQLLEAQEAAPAAQAQPAPAQQRTQAPTEQAPGATQAGPPDDAQPATKGDINAIGYQMNRVGWDEAQGRAYLVKTFGKQSRMELTRGQAADMVEHLKTLPAKKPAAAGT